jgi:transcriptional antiterminator Rof (Rho-off)
MTDYQPIACALHDRYEIAVMHRTRLTLCWQGPDGLTHLENLLPEDLETSNGEEFLVASNRAGERLRLRLDRITAVNSREFAGNT